MVDKRGVDESDEGADGWEVISHREESLPEGSRISQLTESNLRTDPRVIMRRNIRLTGGAVGASEGGREHLKWHLQDSDSLLRRFYDHF